MKVPFFTRLNLAYKVAIGTVSKRYFEGASTSRLTSDWGTTVTSADAELMFLLKCWKEVKININGF